MVVACYHSWDTTCVCARHHRQESSVSPHQLGEARNASRVAHKENVQSRTCFEVKCPLSTDVCMVFALDLETQDVHTCADFWHFVNQEMSSWGKDSLREGKRSYFGMHVL